MSSGCIVCCIIVTLSSFYILVFSELLWLFSWWRWWWWSQIKLVWHLLNRYIGCLRSNSNLDSVPIFILLSEIALLEVVLPFVSIITCRNIIFYYLYLTSDKSYVTGFRFICTYLNSDKLYKLPIWASRRLVGCDYFTSKLSLFVTQGSHLWHKE